MLGMVRPSSPIFPSLYLFKTQGHCDINLRNNKRQTPLALAVSEAYTGMIELLIEHGANVNADDEDGDTPLHLAVIHQAVGGTALRGVSAVRIFINEPIDQRTDGLTD